MNKKSIITLSAAGIMILGLVSPKPTQAFWPFNNPAQENSQAIGFQSLVDKIAERFGLNQADVQEVFESTREERQAERFENRDQRHEERVLQAVEDGKITQEQADLLNQKHEEMDSFHESLKEVDSTQRREAMQRHHEEMKAWADESGIELPIFGFGKKGGGMGHGNGMGRHAMDW